MHLGNLFSEDELGAFTYKLPPTFKLPAGAFKLSPGAIKPRVVTSRPLALRARPTLRPILRPRPSMATLAGAQQAAKQAKLQKIAAAFAAKARAEPAFSAKMRAQKRAPISAASPEAYRRMCSNAGVGGSAAMNLLNDIYALVKRADTRAIATNEHDVLNNTQAFRAAVLKQLRRKLRGRK